MEKINQNIKDVSDAWRILGDIGLVDAIFNHISFLTPVSTGGFQIAMNPNNLLAREVAEENICVFPLKKYSASDSSELKVNPDGLQLHSALHTARMKEGAIIHTHSKNVIAVSCFKDGLLPLSQTAIEFVGDIEYVNYDGFFRSNNLTLQLSSFAKKGGVALLRHHGALVIADTIEEAFYLTYYIEDACKIQVLTLSQGGPFITPEQTTVKAAQEVLRKDRARVAKEFFDAFKRKKK